jgi:hypothetical protein
MIMREWINLFESTGYDLQAKYDLFNRLYFNGELPRIPLGWKKMKRTGGHVAYTTTPIPGVTPNRYDKNAHLKLKPDTLALYLSPEYIRDEESLDGLMMHEMIHVYEAIKGKFDENHGLTFLVMRRKLQELSGMKIPLTDKVDGLELSDKTVKPVWAAVYIDKDGGYAYALGTEKAVKGGKEEFEGAVGRWGRYNRVIAGRIATPAWTKLAAGSKTQRSFKMTSRAHSADAKAAIADLDRMEVLYDIRRSPGDQKS